MHALLLAALLSGLSDEPYPAWESTLVKTSAHRREKPAGHRLSPSEIAELVRSSPPIPFVDVTAGVRLADGTIWAGSPRGLMRRGAGDSRWRLFHSRVWLADDAVVDLSAVSGSSCFVKTKGGVNWIRRRSTTLSKKMAAIEAHVHQRALRLGLVGEIELSAAGSLQRGLKPTDSDNNGLWTGMYVASESLRYGATGDAEARQFARRSLRALMFLESITGQPGFVARSVVPAATKEVHDPENWRAARDPKWRWKTDTSSDEIVGHYFAYAAYYDLVATAEEKEEIRKVVERITDHILDNGYYYVAPDGKQTTWGVWAPRELNDNPKRRAERGLNSLEILSHLKVASHIVGKPRYAEAARELIEKHGYATNTINQKITDPTDAVSHSDDELAFLAYYPLLLYERDAKLRAIYMQSLDRSWRIERPEGSPLFNAIYAAALQAGMRKEGGGRPAEPLVDPAAYDRDACVDYFREVPGDLIYWPFDNTGRHDASKIPFPVYERGVMKWNGNPYELQHGGDGRLCDDGTFILLPYWMARYHRFID